MINFSNRDPFTNVTPSFSWSNSLQAGHSSDVRPAIGISSRQDSSRTKHGRPSTASRSFRSILRAGLIPFSLFLSVIGKNIDYEVDITPFFRLGCHKATPAHGRQRFGSASLASISKRDFRAKAAVNEPRNSFISRVFEVSAKAETKPPGTAGTFPGGKGGGERV